MVCLIVGMFMKRKAAGKGLLKRPATEAAGFSKRSAAEVFLKAAGSLLSQVFHDAKCQEKTKPPALLPAVNRSFYMY